MKKRTAALVAVAVGVALAGWGTAHAPVGQPTARTAQPAVLPVRVVVLNPASGAVVWSSVALPRRVVLNPATGAAIMAGASMSAR